MNTGFRSPLVVYFFAGVALGIFVGLSISRPWAVLVLRLIAGGIVLTIALFWRRIESYSQKHYLESWSAQRRRGRLSFVISQYVLLRGGLLSVALAGPLFLQLPIRGHDLTAIFAVLVLIAVLMIYLGNESWVQCEREYEVQVLRMAAQHIRTASN